MKIKDLGHHVTLLGVIALALAPQTFWGANPNCPVHLHQISIQYNHQGGTSRPQLSILYEDQSQLSVAQIHFSLAILDANGSPHPYGDNFLSKGVVSVGKPKLEFWDLVPELVDIHRTGEIVVVQQVRFSDGSVWKDKGEETCSLTVDYHGR